MFKSLRRWWFRLRIRQLNEYIGDLENRVEEVNNKAIRQYSHAVAERLRKKRESYKRKLKESEKNEPRSQVLEG